MPFSNAIGICRSKEELHTWEVHWSLNKGGFSTGAMAGIGSRLEVFVDKLALYQFDTTSSQTDKQWRGRYRIISQVTLCDGKIWDIFYVSTNKPQYRSITTALRSSSHSWIHKKPHFTGSRIQLIETGLNILHTIGAPKNPWWQRKHNMFRIQNLYMDLVLKNRINKVIAMETASGQKCLSTW